MAITRAPKENDWVGLPPVLVIGLGIDLLFYMSKEFLLVGLRVPLDIIQTTGHSTELLQGLSDRTFWGGIGNWVWNGFETREVFFTKDGAQVFRGMSNFSDPKARSRSSCTIIRIGDLPPTLVTCRSCTIRYFSFFCVGC